MSRGTYRSAFTLIELLVSISILSILMLALYKAYDALNISNNIYKDKSNSIQSTALKKRTIYLDFALSFKGNEKEYFRYLDQGTKKDIITFQSSNSIHKRYNPYITYIVIGDKLYRIESLQKVVEYPFSSDIVADIDEIGSVNKFKVFISTDKTTCLIDARFKDENNILLKVKSLNNT